MMPLVSICITTYNRKELLSITLKSVLNQTYKNIEVIIVDDCSTDGTEEIVENELLKQDERIRYIRHQQNKGLAAGRNTAIFNARGKYFTFIDDDDLWKNTFIEEFVNLAKYYDDKWCFCSLNRSYQNNAIKQEMNGKLSKYILLGYTPPVASQFYFTSTLIKIGGYDELIKSGVDHDLWLNLSINNYYIRSLNKRLAYPNQDNNQLRITTDFYNRINKIENSLLIWKPKIENFYGNEFYTHFKNAYYHYLTKKAIKIDLKNYKILSALEKISYSPFKYFLIRELTLDTLGKIFNKSYSENSLIPYNGLI